MRGRVIDGFLVIMQVILVVGIVAFLMVIAMCELLRPRKHWQAARPAERFRVIASRGDATDSDASSVAVSWAMDSAASNEPVKMSDRK